MTDPHAESEVDPAAVRELAARVGLPGVPVSLREPADRPGPGAGTGHWRRPVAELSAALRRSEAAVLEVPSGGVRDELQRLLHVMRLRAARYEQMAVLGQAVAPDDDTTLADGTAPGEPPALEGAAAEIDARLGRAVAHLTTVARAVEQIAQAAAGLADPQVTGERLAALFAAAPPP